MAKTFTVSRPLPGSRIHITAADARRGGTWVTTISIPLPQVEALAIKLLEQVYGPLGAQAIVAEHKQTHKE